MDGTGGVPRSADVAVQDGVIVTVGDMAGTAAEEVDAAGCIVTPGFVDVHTHYDGQVTWEDTLAPSSGHGVTTVVMGNRGVELEPPAMDDLAAMRTLTAEAIRAGAVGVSTSRTYAHRFKAGRPAGAVGQHRGRGGTRPGRRRDGRLPTRAGHPPAAGGAAGPAAADRRALRQEGLLHLHADARVLRAVAHDPRRSRGCQARRPRDPGTGDSPPDRQLARSRAEPAPVLAQPLLPGTRAAAAGGEGARAGQAGDKAAVAVGVADRSEPVLHLRRFRARSTVRPRRPTELQPGRLGKHRRPSPRRRRRSVGADLRHAARARRPRGALSTDGELRGADGYRATVVSRSITYRNGETTGALPGRLVRGAQEDPEGIA